MSTGRDLYTTGEVHTAKQIESEAGYIELILFLLLLFVCLVHVRKSPAEVHVKSRVFSPILYGGSCVYNELMPDPV